MNKRKLKKFVKKKGLPMPLSINLKDKFKFKDAGKFPYIKRLTGGQAKIAAKAPPTNKIDAKDFAVLRAEKAKGRGMGLQDEKVKPGKVMKARKGLSFDEKLKRQEKGLTSKTTGKPTSLKALREMKGFKPGETPSDFNKRMDLKKAGIKAAKATKIGKIVLPIAAAGVAAQQYLKSKMKKKDEPKKKMGGGMMMQRPMMVKKGGGADTGRKGEFMSKLGVAINKIKRDRPTRPDLKKLPGKMGGGMIGLMKKAKDKGAKPLEFLSPMAMLKRVQGKNMGGMMNKPMGYKAGKSVKAKCKLGRNKPTKMY